jgi:HK97 family phage portal protein
VKSLGGSLVRALRNEAPVPYVGRRGGGGLANALAAAPAGREAELQAMGTDGTLFSIVHRTSNATAQVNWRLYRKAKSGKDEDRTEVTSHLALDIWNRPNPFYTRQLFVEAEQQHVDLTGEGWWVVARNPAMRSIPLELWPVRPDRIAPVPDPKKFIAGYVYTSPDGEKIPLELDEVIRLIMPNPWDPYRGLGPVQAKLIDLDSAKYSAQWNRNFFINSAQPAGIIQVERQLSDDDFARLRDRWREQHRGVAAAHRVAIIEQGMTYQDRNYSMRDMQFAELRQLSRDVVREAFGIPKFALGDIDDVNRATAEASKAWFAEMLTIPRLERFKQALNVFFLPMFGTTAEGLEFGYDDPVPENAETRDRERTSKAAAAKTYIDAGFTGESVVEALELPEALVWEKPKPPPPPIPPPGQQIPPAEQDDPADEPTTPEALLRRLRNATDRPDWETALDRLLDDWKNISADQRQQIHDQIVTAVNHRDMAALVALGVDSAAAAALLEQAMREQAARGGKRMAQTAADQGVHATAADPEHGDLADEIAALAAVIAALLAASLALAAAREAVRVWGPDSTGQQVAAAVDDHVDALSDRGLRDSLGGGLWAAETAGRFATLKSAPPADYYVAVEEHDDRTCQYCLTINGHRFANLAAAREAYPTAGYIHCLGGIRCRGGIEPRWEAN